MPLTSGKQDSKLVLKQTVVNSNSACYVCKTIFHTTQHPAISRATQQPKENVVKKADSRSVNFVVFV